MAEQFEVDAEMRLQDFLRTNLEGWTGRTIKQRLRWGCVMVNGEAISRYDHRLRPGDKVDVVNKGEGAVPNRRRPAFETIFADSDLIAIDKPAGLLSVPTDNKKKNEKNALGLVRDSLSDARTPAQLWPVHRLDRETSGVLLFARSREVRDIMQANWAEATKTYVAVVEGQLENEEGVIDQPLWEDNSLNVRVGARDNAKECRTVYRTRQKGRHRTMLEVDLETGRRHQIRVHLAWLGNPVVGDRRYGRAEPRLALHSHILSVTHPRGDTQLSFKSPVPRVFTSMVKAE